MKAYLTIRPLYQGGEYPKIPFDLTIELRELTKQYSVPGQPNFYTTMEVNISGLLDERETFKKERKPKPIEQQSVKQWGSKNSQMRLDKATARYAKKLNKGGCTRYY